MIWKFLDEIYVEKMPPVNSIDSIDNEMKQEEISFKVSADKTFLTRKHAIVSVATLIKIFRY